MHFEALCDERLIISVLRFVAVLTFLYFAKAKYRSKATTLTAPSR